MALILAPVAPAFAEDATLKATLEGTYKLISRKLPDGTMLYPPDVVGFATLYKGYRTVQVLWKGPDSKYSSFSHVGVFTITTNEYSETNVLTVFHDAASGKEVSYDISRRSGSSPVTVEDGRVKLQLPNEPLGVIEGNKWTATMPDAFVDLWEKIE